MIAVPFEGASREPQPGQVPTQVASLDVSQAVYPEHSDNIRPFRTDDFRDVLDEEFQRSYRFEGLGNVLHDIKELFRNLVSREDDDYEFPGGTAKP